MVSKTLNIPAASASHFAKDDRNFEGLIDALATGDVVKAMKAATDSGMSEKQASHMVRDSSALASAVLSIGDMMSW